jgi:hypothetical protein
VTDNRWGQARIEVTALKALITQRLDEGYSIRRVWLELRSQGLVTVALCNFYRQIPQLQEKPEAGQLPLAPAPVTRAVTTLQTAPASKRVADTTISQFHLDPVSPPLILTPDVEDAEQREQDDHAS